MKTVGIALLFGLCAAIGMRLCARKTERLAAVRELKQGKDLFAEQIAAGGTLKALAKREGRFFSMLAAYLAALEAGGNEAEAAEAACRKRKATSPECDAMRLFFDGLSASARGDLLRRIETLSHALDRAEAEAETEAKQARVIRVSGVLIGAGLAIVLW